jgi:MFS family permease
MSAQAAAPNSTSLERDARARQGSEHGVVPGEIAIGVIIGRTSEFFDFFVYAIASVIVFPALVFPFVDRLTGTLLSFGIFALAFMARPIGSLIFMWIDRRHGRGVKLTIALFLLGGSTAAIAWPCSAPDKAWRWAAPGMASPRCSRSTRRATNAAGMR